MSDKPTDVLEMARHRHFDVLDRLNDDRSDHRSHLIIAEVFLGKIHSQKHFSMALARIMDVYPPEHLKKTARKEIVRTRRHNLRTTHVMPDR